MSDISKIKKRLQNYKSLHDEVGQLWEKVKEIENSLDMIKAVVISDMPKGNSIDKDSIGKILSMLEETRRLYYEKLNNMLCELHFIERLIEGLESIERQLMRKRYIEGKKWETVAEEMHYSWKQIHIIHSRALCKIEITYEVTQLHIC